MSEELNEYINFVKHIGFDLQNGRNNVYAKQYGGYKIECDFDKNRIDYGDKIQIGREATNNFKQGENLVVLECVNRLLEKGYNPESIELEASWKLGHRGKGFLDILVRKKDGTAILMIECKTWGVSFNNEKRNMLKDGGQLLSYFRQDTNAKLLCLYASKLEGGSSTPMK